MLKQWKEPIHFQLNQLSSVENVFIESEQIFPCCKIKSREHVSA